MRQVHPSLHLARLLGALRQVAVENGRHDAPSDPSPELELDSELLDELEDTLEDRIPDDVLAYLAAGVSVWGDGPVSLEAVADRTEEVQELLEDHGAELDAPFLVIDDDSNGNFVLLLRGQLVFLDHEGGYRLDEDELEENDFDEDEGMRIDLVETLRRAVRDDMDRDDVEACDPVTIILV